MPVQALRLVDLENFQKNVIILFCQVLYKRDLKKVKGGGCMEKQQIAALYEAYAEDVYRLALSWLCSTHDAEDILQNVFLKLLDQDITVFSGSEKAWLLKCTANACKNHLRSFWQRNTQALDENIALPTNEDRTLWEAVGKLKPTYRAVIHLYYYEGYRQDEIAKILGISRTAVQTRMQRARESLKKELNKNG